jgi:hypothetical protein
MGIQEGFTLAESSAIVFGSTTVAALGPVALAVAAVVAVGFALKKIDEALRQESDLTAQKLGQIADKNHEVATAQLHNAQEATKLVRQYQDVKYSNMQAAEKAEKLRIIYDAIYRLMPDLTKGYDDQLRPLGLVADAYDKIREAAQAATKAQQESATMKNFGVQYNELQQHLQAINAVIGVIKQRGVQVPIPEGADTAKYSNYDSFQSIMSGSPDRSHPETFGLNDKNWRNINPGTTDSSTGIWGMGGSNNGLHPDFGWGSSQIYTLEKGTKAYRDALQSLELQARGIQDEINALTKSTKDALNPTPAKPLTLPTAAPTAFIGKVADLTPEIDRFKAGLKDGTIASENSCARFVSALNKATGVAIATDSAWSLVEKALTSGGREVERAKAKIGDIIYYQGPAYGSKEDKALHGGEGRHVEYYLGNNRSIGSHDGDIHTSAVRQDAHFIRPERGDQSGYDLLHQTAIDYASQQRKKISDAKKEERDAAREALKEHKEASKIIEELRGKYVELQGTITAGILTTNQDTDAQKLAAEYRKANVSNFYELNKAGTALVLTSNKEKQSEMAVALALQARNVQVQQRIDLIKKLSELQEKAAEKAKKAQHDAILEAMPERKRKAVEAFGEENYFNNSLMSTQEGKHYLNVASDASNKEEDAKHLKEAVKLTNEALLEGKGAATNYEKAIQKIAETDRYWLESGLAIPSYLKGLNNELERKAILEDRKPFFEAFNSANRPIQRSIQEQTNWQAGNVDTRSQAIDNFKSTNSEYQKLIKQSANGESFVAQANELADAFARDWDLKDKNRQLSEMNKTLFDTVHAAAMLATKDPFEKWRMSHAQYDSSKNTVTNNFSQNAAAVGVSEKDIFNLEQAVAAQQKMDALEATIRKTTAEMSAMSPFEAWELQFKEFDEVTQQWKLPPSLQAFADQGGLKKIFEFEQTERLFKQFADNTADIVTNLFNQIASGAKVSWSSIGRQFEVMLFKMAQEMANSQMKQWFSGALSKQLPGIPGVGGTNAVNQASQQQLSAAMTQFSTAIPSSVTLFQEAVTNFSSSVAGMNGGSAGGVGGIGLPGFSGSGGGSDPLSGYTLNGEGVGPLGAGDLMSAKVVAPTYGAPGSNVGAGQASISNDNSMSTYNFHYHIHGRDDSTIRNTVTQSMNDLTRMQASTHKRTG